MQWRPADISTQLIIPWPSEGNIFELALGGRVAELRRYILLWVQNIGKVRWTRFRYRLRDICSRSNWGYFRVCRESTIKLGYRILAYLGDWWKWMVRPADIIFTISFLKIWWIEWMELLIILFCAYFANINNNSSFKICHTNANWSKWVNLAETPTFRITRQMALAVWLLTCLTVGGNLFTTAYCWRFALWT